MLDAPRPRWQPLGLTGYQWTVIFAAWLVPALLMFTAPAIQYGPVVSLALMMAAFWHFQNAARAS